MMVVGLTGGIGSGKTTVARLFEEFGVPVFIADLEAKKIMEESAPVKEAIVNYFGEEAYTKEKPNRAFLAAIVFQNKKKLEVLNNIIHPEVAKKFQEWKKQQSAAYVLYEAAILFEKGGYKNCDYNILVTAPKEKRIERVVQRDQVTVQEVEARMDKQWTDEKKIALADFIIENIRLEELKQEVQKLHRHLLQLG